MTKFKRLKALERRLGIKKGLPMLDIVMQPIAPLFDAEGDCLYGGQRCDSMRAKLEDSSIVTFFDRNPGESLEEFEDRVLATPRYGHVTRVLSFPPEPPAA
jgi:hypothetical protein